MQATRQSRAKVKRNIPPRSGDQPQQLVYSIPTRTTNREDRNDRNRAKVRRRGRERDEAGSFLCALRPQPGVYHAGNVQAAGPNQVRPHTSRLAVRGGEPLTMQRSERWAVFQARGHNGQHGDIASPRRSIRDHGLAVDAPATLPGRSLVHLTFLVSVAYVLLERTRAESFTSGRRGAYRQARC